MKLVYVRNKENGTTYVYESRYYWNREKQQSRSRRVCIGKLDGEGNLIPSARFSKPLPETIASQGVAAAGRPAKRLYFGGVYLLEGLSVEAEARFLSLQEKRRKGRTEAARLQDVFPPAGAGASPGERIVCGMGFTVLCAMILLSAVLKRMAGNGFFKGWTAQQVFDRLDLIECSEGPDGRPEEGFLSGEEERLLTELGVSPPEASEADRPVQ